MDASNIRAFFLFFKSFFDNRGADLGLFLVIVFACLAAFGLGRLSAQSPQKEALFRPVEAQNHAQTALALGSTAEASKGDGTVVASKSGSVYHLPWCPGAARISPQNLVTYESEEAAKRAGLTAAKNCKGLGQ